MARSESKLDPSLEIAAKERLKPNEIILSQMKLPDGQVRVFVIDEELQSISEEFCLGANCVRGLDFKRENDGWVLTAEGGWIS